MHQMTRIPWRPKTKKKQIIHHAPVHQQPDQTEVDGLGGIVGSFPPLVLDRLKTLWSPKASK